MGMVDLNGLNEAQKQAVLTTEGPVLIIAGPGTGKTFTLVKRLAWLVIEKNVPPGEIMVVTFTEKAGRELLTRISNEFLQYDQNINLNEMYIGTFHSIFLRLLKENSEYSEEENRLRMLDSFEQTYLVCRNMELFEHLGGFSHYIPTRQGRWKQAMEICRYVNLMMEEMVDLDAMERDMDPDMRFLARLTTRYQDLLRRNGAMDFSSIQTKTYDMLKNQPEVLKKLQESIRYIMVDEYQDTNYIQEQLTFLIAGDRKNICVVGDDDQGMYRFRGATIRNILEFPDQFGPGECRLIHLNANYRSEPDIIRFYSRWMESSDGINLFNWDKYRFPKDLTAARTDLTGEKRVFSCGGRSIENESAELLGMVRRLQKNGNITDLNQVAFLFRSVKSTEAKQIGEYFEANGIPVYSPRSELFFERAEVKQLLGCLMMCFESYTNDLKTNRFNIPISQKLRQYYQECGDMAKALFRGNNELKAYVAKQRVGIRDVQGTSDYGLLDLFYRLISYPPFCDYLQVSLNERADRVRPARNLSEVSRLLSNYSFLHGMHDISGRNKLALPEELFNVYLKYLYEDGIGEYEDASEYAPRGCVSFMTIHQSKGLEFPAVVVGSMGAVPKKNADPLLMTVENRFFHRRPFEPIEDIKYFDFWRLYYTAFSRAQDLLVLSAKDECSRYFGGIMSSLPDIRAFTDTRPFAVVKDAHFKHVYSFTSHIAVYDGCPKQYKFYKEYGFSQNKMFQTSIGSLVHATLEDMNKCAIRGEYERINEDAIREWFTQNYRSMQEVTGYYLTDQQLGNAQDQILRYYRHRKEELGHVWKSEEEINLVLPEYILQGIVDLVEGYGDTVEIVDYKTGPKPDHIDHPERVSHYKKQLEIYAYLIAARYGKDISRMHLYYTSVKEGQDPLITFEWEKSNVDEAIMEVSDTVKRIENREFEEGVQNNYACRFCDMRYVCGKES